MYIVEYNSNPHNTATLGINKFANLTHEEWQQRFNPIDLDFEEVLIEDDADIQESSFALPSNFDWREKDVVTRIYNEG